MSAMGPHVAVIHMELPGSCILECKHNAYFFLFGIFMSKERYAGNGIIWNALLLH